MNELNHQSLRTNIRDWLNEDLGTGDVTSWSTIAKDHQSIGIIHLKEAGIVAGVEVAQAVFTEVDPTLIFRAIQVDGAFVSKGEIIATVEGSTHSILIGERLSLNLLQRMSGIATRTRQYVNAIENLPTRIVDTRKTTPGHRMLEKYAVRMGGGANHRFGLYDAVMIKDNHIKASGSIELAIHAARNHIPHTMKIEIEVENLAQVEQAIAANADIIMLDNMSVEDMTSAVKLIKKQKPHIIVEGSGSVTLENVKLLASSGVDVLSIGRLTHSFQSLDISLDLNEMKEAVR